jgi:hypothetical protein
LSAAVHLLEQGKSVCVLEAHRAGHGGSGRNVGLVNAGLWIPPDDIEAGFGEAVGSQLNRMLGAAPALVFSLVDKYNIDCQLRREGTLHMAHNARAKRICAVAKNNGSAVARRSSCSPAGLRTSHGHQKIAAALLDRRAGTLNPMAYTTGLANAAIGLGGQMFDHSPVTRSNARASNGRCRPPGFGAGRASGDRLQRLHRGRLDRTTAQFLPRLLLPGRVGAADRRRRATHPPGGQGSWDPPGAQQHPPRQGRPVCCSAVWATAIRNRRGSSRRGPIAQQHYFPYLKPVEWECTWTGRIAFTPIT